VAFGRTPAVFLYDDEKLRRCAHSCGAVADLHRLPEHPGESPVIGCTQASSLRECYNKSCSDLEGLYFLKI
jgi:hypothetical protein